MRHDDEASDAEPDVSPPPRRSGSTKNSAAPSSAAMDRRADPVLGDHDGETISLAQAQALRGRGDPDHRSAAARTAASAGSGPAPPLDGTGRAAQPHRGARPPAALDAHHRHRPAAPRRRREPAAGHLAQSRRAARRGRQHHRDRSEHDQRHDCCCGRGSTRCDCTRASRRSSCRATSSTWVTASRSPSRTSHERRSARRWRRRTFRASRIVDVLGSGGFADVYLYEQQLPKRRVAVKVLIADRMSSGSVEEFTAEANVMAMLSTHPAIVTIYQAGVAAGRPSVPGDGVLPEAEPPGAVPARAVLGRRIAARRHPGRRARSRPRTARACCTATSSPPTSSSPSTTARRSPTSASHRRTSAAAESAGLSIPWSPPESFADVPRSDPRSDVYAARRDGLLAARRTLAVRAGRTSATPPPSSSSASSGCRCPRSAAADAPAVARSVRWSGRWRRRPADRYESALAFARALQKVQIELSHSVTPIDILDDAVVEDDADDDDDGLTRVRGVVSIDPATDRRGGLHAPPSQRRSGDAVHSRPPRERRRRRICRRWTPSCGVRPPALTDGVAETVLRAAAAHRCAACHVDCPAPSDRGGPHRRAPEPVGTSPQARSRAQGSGSAWRPASSRSSSIVAVSLPGAARRRARGHSDARRRARRSAGSGVRRRPGADRPRRDVAVRRRHPLHVDESRPAGRRRITCMRS